MKNILSWSLCKFKTCVYNGIIGFWGGISMSEAKKTEQLLYKEKETEKEKQGEKRNRIITISVAVFLTFCCCAFFFFFLLRNQEFAAYGAQIFGILQPIIIGIVLAYLLNPIMVFIEMRVIKVLNQYIKNEKRAKNVSRMTGIAGAWLFFAIIIIVLIASILPTITDSIMSMIRSFPDAVNNLLTWLNEVVEDGSELEVFLNDVIVNASEWFQTWMKETLLPELENYIAPIMSGAVAGVRMVLNIFIGAVVSVYVLASKDTFSGQVKKMVYAFFKPSQANVIIDTARKSHELFGGFISGKLLDSLIIGILAYIVLSVMQMPYTMLVSVIVGVTNVIPFFGPFIGAIPSFFIILLQDPMKSLYFLIFILILQQIDGNIIGPKILGNTTGISAFWIVFSTTFFGGLWGFPGMVLGVPMTAVILHIASCILEYMLKKRGIPAKTEDYVRLKKIDQYTNEPIYDKSEEK